MDFVEPLEDQIDLELAAISDYFCQLYRSKTKAKLFDECTGLMQV